jgi:hypothetical protein
VNDTAIDLDQADEEILTYTVSDEALEAAAGTGTRSLAYSFAITVLTSGRPCCWLRLCSDLTLDYRELPPPIWRGLGRCGRFDQQRPAAVSSGKPWGSKRHADGHFDQLRWAQQPLHADGLPSLYADADHHAVVQLEIMASERIVFTEENNPQQYLKLVASGEVDDTLLEAIWPFLSAPHAGACLRLRALPLR